MRVANRMGRLGGEGMGSILRQVAQFKEEGKRVIPMHAGEPDFDTPANIVASAVEALGRGETHYTPAAGIPLLRAAIADHASPLRDHRFEPGQVVVFPGAKPAIYAAILALCQAGDEVICPEPAYPFYASLAHFVGATVVSLPLTLETGFRYDPATLERLVTPRTRLIVLNSPSNPTGQVISRDDLAGIATIARRHDIWVLSDEIYSRIVYDGDFHSIVSLPKMAERTIIVDGYSKTYAMTGWRLGYALVPPDLAPYLTSIVLNTLSCNVAFIQSAAIEALRGPQDAVDRMVSQFRQRRDRIIAGLRHIPQLTCHTPQGAFYAFVRVNGLQMTSMELARRLLVQGGVAAYPGSAFGPAGEGFIRLSFACSEQDIDEGLQRIHNVLARL